MLRIVVMIAIGVCIVGTTVAYVAATKTGVQYVRQVH